MNIEEALDVVAEGVSEYRLGRKMSIAGALKAGEGLVIIRQGIKHGDFSSHLERWELPSSTANDWMKLSRSGYTVPQIVDLGGIRATLESIRQYQPQLPEPHQTSDGRIFEETVIDDIADDDGEETSDGPEPEQPEMELPATVDEPETSDGRTFDASPIVNFATAAGTQPAPRATRPKPAEQAEAKIALLEIENAEQAATIEQQGRAIRHLEAQFGEAEWPKQQVIQELEQTVAAQRASIGEWQVKHEDLNRAHQGALRQIRLLEKK